MRRHWQEAEDAIAEAASEVLTGDRESFSALENDFHSFVDIWDGMQHIGSEAYKADYKEQMRSLRRLRIPCTECGVPFERILTTASLVSGKASTRCDACQHDRRLLLAKKGVATQRWKRDLKSMRQLLRDDQDDESPDGRGNKGSAWGKRGDDRQDRP